jgi:hypothetical protein
MRFTKNKDSDGIHWYVRRNRKVRGPFPSGTIRRLVSAQRVVLTDEVSLDNVLWREVRLVDEVLPPGMRGASDKASVDDYSGLLPDQPLPFEQHQGFPTVPLAVGLLAIGSLLALFFLLEDNAAPTMADCNAAPAPGVNWNNCKLPGIQAAQRDLGGLQASNADLSGGTFTAARLQGAKLQYANLIGADFSYADLSQASLKGATLRNSDLSNTDLSGADLSFADLSNANLANSRLDNAIWSGNTRCASGSLGACRLPGSTGN